MIVRILSALSEFERDLISTRIKEALKYKQESGKILGRPKGPGKSRLDAFKPEIIALLQNGSTKKFVAERYRTTPANLFNWLKMNSIKISKGVLNE